MRAATLGLLGTLALPGPAQAALTACVVEWGELYAEVTGLIGPEHEQHALIPALATRAPEFTRRTDRIEARLCGQSGVAVALRAERSRLRRRGRPLPPGRTPQRAGTCLPASSP